MTNHNFEKIFNGLNNGAMIANPAYNMQAVAQTFPQETADWNSQNAVAYRKYAMEQMEKQVKSGNPVWLPTE